MLQDEIAGECSGIRLRMNQIQVIGTHNSYHVQPDEALLARLKSINREVESLEYTHRPLREQFEEQKIRQIELDLYADPEGGLFYHRAGRVLVGEETASHIPELREPGFKVMHIPHIDYLTHHLTLTDALSVVREWSLANPHHVPVMVLVELKEALPMSGEMERRARAAGVSVRRPVEIGPEELDLLEEEILSVLDDSHIIVPDSVRGDRDTLEEAILTDGWPLLEDARGRLILAMDNTDRIREQYMEGSPSLEGRLLFTSSAPGSAGAAFVKINEPVGNEEYIRECVRRGYLVRTRADSDLRQVSTGDTARRDAAFRSGAHYVSTDFPAPGEGCYVVELPRAGGRSARINPVNRPSCEDLLS